jgi:hypothetical protein
MKTGLRAVVARRSFLAGLGTTAAGAFIRPLVAAAQSATGSPQRILLIHRPCGTDMTQWWPTGGTSDWVSSPLLSSFDKLRNDMVILRGVDCPRKQNWIGDKHGAGMIAMVAPPPMDKADGHVWPALPGYTLAEQNDTNAKFFTATDKSIDQLYLERVAALKGTAIPSVQLSSSLESADSTRDCCLRVVSYSKSDPSARFPTPLWPESRANIAFMNIFGKVLMGVDQARIARTQAQNKSVLDFITGGLTGMKGQLPASQIPKIDAHMTAIRDLEKSLSAIGTGRVCAPPTLGALPATVNGLSQLDTEHYQSSLNHMQIIKTMFQCDVTRVASFTFGYGNSDIKFVNVLNVAGLVNQYKDTKGGVIVDKEGHHNISHNGGTGFKEAQYIIDKVYCDITAKLLLDMKNTPDGIGSDTLLDNTLVIFWNECSDGNSHDTADMPVLLFGGKFLKLQAGQYLQFGKNARYMSDFWVETAKAWGIAGLTSYGDPMWNKGPMPGIYG